MTQITDLPLARLKRTLVLAAVALAATGLAACEHLDTSGGPSVAGWLKAESPEDRHAIVVSQQPQTMRLRVGTNSRGLTPQQRGELLSFADRSNLGRGSNTRVVINAPGGSVNESAAMDAVGEIRTLLASLGTPDSSIAVEAIMQPNSVRPRSRSPCFTMLPKVPYAASGREPREQSRKHDLVQLRLFAPEEPRGHVANPADLEGPRSFDPRPGERRDQQWNSYVKGDTTNAKKSEDEKISIKSAVNN